MGLASQPRVYMSGIASSKSSEAPKHRLFEAAGANGKGVAAGVGLALEVADDDALLVVVIVDVEVVPLSSASIKFSRAFM